MEWGILHCFAGPSMALSSQAAAAAALLAARSAARVGLFVLFLRVWWPAALWFEEEYLSTYCTLEQDELTIFQFAPDRL